jgi:hypothetical protein
VASEISAVASFTQASNQYAGRQMFRIAIRCVVPHAKMNAPNIRKIQSKRRSRLRRTK